MTCPSASAPTSTARPRTASCGSIRDTPRHEIVDLNVSSQLRGAALVDSYLTGDNALVVATDTQKNTAFAFAKEHGIPSPEEYLLKLVRALRRASSTGSRAGSGRPSSTSGSASSSTAQPHDHSFVRKGQGTRLAAVQVVDGATHVTGGVKDLTVLKSTGSEFAGFPRDRYTTLVETDDRIMATSVTGRWRFLPEAVEAGIDYNGLYAEVSAVLLVDLRDRALARAAADAVRDGQGRDRGAARDRRGALRDAEQAPLRSTTWRPSASRTRARSSTPPTARTA